MAKHGLNCAVLELPSSTRTALDAAGSVGCTIKQIAKSLVFKTKITHRAVLVITSGPNKVDEKIISLHVGEEITKADADFAREITGFAIGGFPPVGHETLIELVYIDKNLMVLETIWTAAGMPNAVFRIKSAELLSITKAKVIAVTN